MVLDIVFRGITAPLRLTGAETVLPILPDVAVGWPYHCRQADPNIDPFFSISAEPGERLLRCEWHIEDRPPRRFDPVNALCDAVSALAFALPAENPRLICLHAAAVAMAGQLVVFPNIRRAGKSMLSAALARAGHGLFSDDVLPISFAPDNRARGHAMGIAPRLRLPLPVTITPDFRQWVDAVGGPRNRQYLYLKLPEQPTHGTSLSIGAFVILDRHEEPVEARLDAVTPDVAMDALLHQNFTRDRHSADVLQALAATLTDRPIFRLRYYDLFEAVTCLERQFERWPDPERREASGSDRSFRMAEFGTCDRSAGAADRPVMQRPGTVEVQIGERLYLADREGRAIHRMDWLASAIWIVLAEPIAPAEIEDLLVEAFPEAGRDRISTDLRRLLTQFDEAGLIELPSGK
jgi:hypothetical protein